MASAYDPLAGRIHSADRLSANTAQSFGALKKPSRVFLPGGALGSSAPSSHTAAAAHGGGGGGLISGWVWRPNHLLQHQAFYQKNAGAINIHRMGPRDGAINRGIAGVTLLGLGCVLFSLVSMSLGVNKKKSS